uniref:Uncharacterized protein n=1 Tax=Glossina austeni TaxID=7395 RepID=A0A1A9VFH4_GLOAU
MINYEGKAIFHGLIKIFQETLVNNSKWGPILFEISTVIRFAKKTLTFTDFSTNIKEKLFYLLITNYYKTLSVCVLCIALHLCQKLFKLKQTLSSSQAHKSQE